MKIASAYILYAVIALSGCATYRPIVDMAGVDLNQFERDLTECQGYAVGVSPSGQAVVGAGIGALFVAAVGGILCGRDCAGQGAALGAISGGASAGAEGAVGQAEIIKGCLSGRGYSVLR